MKEIIHIKVRGYHIDLYGHVNNTRYLEFLEEARWTIKEKYFDFMHEHAKGLGIVVVSNHIDYHHAATLGDALEIRTCISRIGNKSAVFRHEIYLADTDTLVVDAEVTFVIMDFNTGRAIPLSEEWRTRLELLLE